MSTIYKLRIFTTQNTHSFLKCETNSRYQQSLKTKRKKIKSNCLLYFGQQTNNIKWEIKIEILIAIWHCLISFNPNSELFANNDLQKLLAKKKIVEYFKNKKKHIKCCWIEHKLVKRIFGPLFLILTSSFFRQAIQLLDSL